MYVLYILGKAQKYIPAMYRTHSSLMFVVLYLIGSLLLGSV